MSYSDKVLDHYSNPRNVGSIDKSSSDVGTGLVGAPECGDVMKLQIKVNRETNVIEDAKFKTFGCGSAIASSSLATEWVKGKTVDEALDHQEHGHREGASASAGEDPLFGAGRRRDPRRHRRLEEEAGSRTASSCRSEVVSTAHLQDGFERGGSSAARKVRKAQRL
jgi:NifU-like protein involved in Fe-S cluster formation